VIRLTSLDGVPSTAFDTNRPPDNSVGTNPADPLVISSDRQDGHTAQFFGQKSGSGVPQSLNAIKVKDPFDRGGDILNDGSDRPSQITDDEDGDILGIDYTSDPNDIVLSGLTLSGKLQALLAIGLDAPFGKAGPSVDGPRSGAVKGWASDVPPVDRSTTKAAGSTVVTVSQCQAPVDNAAVTLNVSVGDQTFDLPGVPTGGGRYEITLPTVASSQGGVSGQTSCQEFVDRVGGGCQSLDRLDDLDIPGICRSLAETMASNLPDDDDLDTNLEGAVDFMESCSFSLYAAKLSCDSAGGRSPQQRQNFVCNNVVEEVDRSLDALGGSATFTVTARVPGSADIVSDIASNVNTSGPFPDFDFSTSDVVAINDFFTDPIDPAPGESYLATARISCAPNNTPVLMTITGTDGFTGSNQCTISGSGECNLQVPGASQGIRDTITVEVEGGPTRQIQIVF